MAATAITQSAITRSERQVGKKHAGKILVLTAVLALGGLSGCSTFTSNDGAVVHRGYNFDDQTLAQVRVGSPAEQVLVLLGTPSTTSTVGGDAWYYISQKVERMLPSLPAKVTDQHVYAVYFDKNKKVTRIANYTLQDGRPVDSYSGTTVTAGGESRMLQSIWKQMSGLQYKMF